MTGNPLKTKTITLSCGNSPPAYQSGHGRGFSCSVTLPARRPIFSPLSGCRHPEKEFSAQDNMYLTDYREMTLTDVITKLEPDLFKRVTGLNVKDFDLLVSLGVFNSAHMNGTV
jgi:hypothetical protein